MIFSRSFLTSGSMASRIRQLRHANVALCVSAALGCAAVLGCGSDDDDSQAERPATTTGSGTGTSGTGAGAGNMTSPGTGASTGTTNSTATGSAASGTGAGDTAATGGMGTPNASATAGTGQNTGSTGVNTGSTGASGSGAGVGTAGGTTGTSATADAGAGDAGSGAAGIASAQALDDGQIVFVVDTLNAGEVDQARAAMPRLASDDVRAFAQQMIDDHEPARDALIQLAEAQNIDPELSDVADQLREQSAQVVASLLSAPGDSIDAAYIDSQVVAHEQALGLLSAMGQVADSDALRTQITELSTDVQGHLDNARQLQSNLSQ